MGEKFSSDFESDLPSPLPTPTHNNQSQASATRNNQSASSTTRTSQSTTPTHHKQQLSTSLHQQTLEYFRMKHRSSTEELIMFIECESFHPLQVKKGFNVQHMQVGIIYFIVKIPSAYGSTSFPLRPGKRSASIGGNLNFFT